MKEADPHPSEAERLKSLERLQILDTIPEKEFDEITLIASQICGTPIALISLVDKDRQWFKARTGLSATETSRDVAFCAHAILGEEVFVVPDSSKDERFADNPLVTSGPQVAFYAGAPLLDPISQLPIGTLCVIDQRPRSLDPSQLKALEALAHQVSKLLELRLRLKDSESSNQKLQLQKLAFENMSEGVVLQDRSGRILDFNPAAPKVLGLSPDQLKGKTSMDPDWKSIREDGSEFPGQDHPAMVALRTGLPQRSVNMGIQTQDSETRWISITSTPLFDGASAEPYQVVTTFIDVTNDRLNQLMLAQTAKMKSLGEMAGGIAHEINTPLAIICSAANQVQYFLSISDVKLDVVSKLVGKIEMTGHRIGQIVRGLRVVARDSERDPVELTSIQLCIHDAVALCAERYRTNGVDLHLELGDDVEVMCVPAQVSQVVMNLLHNAFDAVISLSEKWVRVVLHSENRIVTMRVIDSGRGISPDVESKIMQPFFTTKEVGKGTGLGLSISKGLIENMSGRLFYDRQSSNTCFVVEFPISELVQRKIG